MNDMMTTVKQALTGLWYAFWILLVVVVVAVIIVPPHEVDDSVEAVDIPGSTRSTDDVVLDAYVTQVDRTTAVIDRELAELSRRSGAVVPGDAVADIAVAAEWWLPSGAPCGVPSGWEEFDRSWMRAMHHLVRGSDAMLRSDAEMWEQYRLGLQDLDEAGRHLPPGYEW